MTKKLFTKILIIFLLIAVYVVTFIVVLPPFEHVLPYKMMTCAQDQVYVLTRGADKYYDNRTGKEIWQYNLSDKELIEALKCINDYPDEWYDLDGANLSHVIYLYENKKIDLDKLSESGVYFCRVDVDRKKILKPQESSWREFAIFILDRTQGKYYCILDVTD